MGNLRHCQSFSGNTPYPLYNDSIIQVHTKHGTNLERLTHHHMSKICDLANRLEMIRACASSMSTRIPLLIKTGTAGLFA